MQVVVYPDAIALGEAIAGQLVDLLAAKPTAVLALASGKTPVPIYQSLVARHRQGQVSFARATIFALDEYVGVDAADPRSFATFFREHLFDHIDLPADQAHVPNGLAADLANECRTLDAKILAAGGFDLCLLGIGLNGHLAMNEPGPVLAAPTHVADLAEQTRATLSPDLAHVRQGITLGMAAIMSSRQLVIAATGTAKAPIVARALLPAIDPQVPASFLQLHPEALLALDAQAGREIVVA
ncbi:MAG: glucosamine-6-phosphate deaminase [Cyanobacteria bacterium REEB65]|nr:glucosamine-6-phosphate deaminase [Cyanobacteria bacterium REEB65]